jgi:DinB superfamily
MRPAGVPVPVDRGAIAGEMAAARGALHTLLTTADPADLRRRSDGTRWTNHQLLFHMVLGYGVVRVLLPLVRLMGRLPAPVGRSWAALLDAAAGPFHVINYAGPVAAARLLTPARIDALGGRVISGLQRALQRETETALHRGMPLPTRWDPYFTEWMPLAEVYRYATRHFEHHRRQLTLTGAPGKSATGEVADHPDRGER